MGWDEEMEKSTVVGGGRFIAMNCEGEEQVDADCKWFGTR